MQLSLVAVGKLRPALREVCDDYLGRLTRFVRVTERQVRESGRAATEQLQRETEGRRLLEAVGEDTPMVLLDIGGSTWSSEQLAAELDRWRLEGRDRALVIGGSTGV